MKKKIRGIMQARKKSSQQERKRVGALLSHTPKTWVFQDQNAIPRFIKMGLELGP